MPKEYLETVQADEAALHIRLIRSLKDKSFIFNYSYNEEGKYYQAILCCPARFEAFKILVGILAARNMNILGAKVYVRKDKIIIISINIEETEILDGNNLETWKNLNQNIRDIFEEHKDLPTLFSERTQYVSEKKLIETTIPKVTVNNESDPNFSIIRIEARDHLGMLYKISTVFAELGKYQKYRTNTLDFMLSFIQDNDRFVRMAVIGQIGLHGSTSHFDLLDSVVGLDPVLSINVRRAKEKIMRRYNKKIKKTDQNSIEKLNKKINEIKSIIDN